MKASDFAAFFNVLIAAVGLAVAFLVAGCGKEEVTAPAVRFAPYAEGYASKPDFIRIEILGSRIEQSRKPRSILGN